MYAAVASAFIWTLILGLFPALMVWGKNMTCCSNDLVMAGARFRLNSDNMLMMVHPHKGGGTSLCTLLKTDTKNKFGRNKNCNAEMEPFEGSKLKKSVDKHILGATFWPDSMAPDEVYDRVQATGRTAFGLEFYSVPSSFGLGSPTYRASATMRRWVFVTIMRHPVERIISQFFYTKNLSSKYASVLEWAQAKDEKNRTTAHVRNFYTMLFSSQPEMFSERYTETPMTAVELARARTTLSHFSVVFILERFEEGLPLLHDYLGLKVPAILPHGKQDKDKDSHRVSQADYDELLRMNQLDMDLYRYAQELHDCRLANLEYTQKMGKLPGEC